MSAGMAEVIAAHDGYMCWTDESEVYIACASPVCDWEAETSDPASSHHAHVAEELAKAGYGGLGEARAVAWDCGFEDGWSEARNPGAFVNDVWDAKTPNPYRVPQHG